MWDSASIEADLPADEKKVTWVTRHRSSLFVRGGDTKRCGKAETAPLSLQAIEINDLVLLNYSLFENAPLFKII